MSVTITNRPPQVGLPVKLKKGMLMLSARQVQRVTVVKKLEIDPKEGLMTQSDVDAEGGYWIKTDYTKGEWWAWSHFRIA